MTQPVKFMEIKMIHVLEFIGLVAVVPALAVALLVYVAAPQIIYGAIREARGN